MSRLTRTSKPKMTENSNLVTRLQQLGLSELKAKETLKNQNVTKNLISILDLTGDKNIQESIGILLYHLGTKIKPQIGHFLPIMVEYIVNQKLDSTLRVDAGLAFLLQHSLNTKDVNRAEFEKNCGVGIIVSPEEIDRTVEDQIKKSKEELLQQRYRFNQGKLMQAVRTLLPWADGKAIKNEVEIQIFDLLGPKTEDDLKPVKHDGKKEGTKLKVEKTATTNSQESDGASSIAELMKNKVHFHAPGENYKTDGYVVTDHTMKLLQDHLKITKGNVRTRFPPEPNGILHIGHAKAININFGYAAAYGGTCYLRYDDTNPEKEEEKFFIGIKNMVEWLGYKPDKVTHSSDNFQQLYEWAIVLIKKGLAYVCHQKSEELKGFNPPPSPWRDRPIEENFILFEDMKNGKIDEGIATLRMKVTLEEGKVDPVAYRIKFVPHHRTGTQWCIYPTYDYTHCLCDSIEHITHSLCTKEFQSRRSSYYWLCNALEIYCPVQWEYGRLNVNYTVVSKRKIAKLITEKIVADWDDPRLFTLTALQRRGFPAEAINNFCAQMGVTGAQGAVDPSMLEAAVRDVLNVTAPRLLVVLEPLKITLKNFSEKQPIEVEIPDFPNTSISKSHTVVFDKIIYIEKSDFKESPEKGYRRLTPNQTVGLRHAGYVIKLEEIIRSGNDIIELICSCESTNTASKPKAFIQWVSNPFEIEVRLYESLFKHKNPEDPNEVPGGFLTDCNLDSLHVLKSYADQSIKTAKIFDKFQFERIGFFSVDPDTIQNSRLVFNRTVTLKEDSSKVE